MNPEHLLEHFDRISEAPDAIPRLRRFILDLAVRGKLVAQDPNDEPAVELLKWIQAAKEKLVKEGEIKKLEKIEPVEASEFPFAIPSGWEARRMGWLARKLGAGSTPLGGKSVYQSAGVPFLRSQNVHNDGLWLDDVALITRSVHERMSGTHVQKQDILLNITGASIGRCALVPETFTEGNVSQHVAIVRLFAPEIRGFIHLSLISPFFQRLIDDVQVGVSREGLSMQRLRLFPMLLPPLAEQHRIVAKVDELMALCDQLETAKTEREQSRDRLVAASLHRLNSSSDTVETDAPDLLAQQADAFRNHARFVFNHLPRLLTRPEHIKQLRQTILNLAVRGHLSPAGDWLEQSDMLRAVALLQNGYAFKSEWFVPNGMRLLRNVNVSHSILCWDELACLPEIRVREFERFLLSEGDIVLSLDRPFIATGIKVARIRPQDLPCLLLQRVGRFHLNSERLCPDYLFLWLNSPHFTNQIDPGRSNGVPHISSKQVEATKIFVPPLAEQHRIVARVDELMALCDQLEAQLTATEADSRRLLEAVLHEALNSLSEVTEQQGHLQAGSMPSTIDSLHTESVP
jgi:type I restriction enzyme S subunit